MCEIKKRAYGVLRTHGFAAAAAAAEFFITDLHTDATSSVCQLISCPFSESKLTPIRVIFFEE